jgi:hypothetical protein
MVAEGRRVVEVEMHFMLECPLFSEDRKLLFEKPIIESELVDRDLSMRRFMNPEPYEGWKYLITFIKKCNGNR